MTILSVSRSYALGLFFILLVALIFAAASILTKHMYTGHSFHSPFILTYIGVTLFTLWLPARIACSATSQLCGSVDETSPLEPYLETGELPPTMTPYKEIDASTKPRDLEKQYYNDYNVDNSKPQPWTDEQHFYAALQIAPVWFLANWGYYAALEYTSITSSTVLMSTGSLFAFLFAVLAKDEKFGWTKLAGVLIGFVGSFITTLSDYKSSDVNEACTENCHSALFGDILGLISAVGYGAYAVQTRVLCPHDESLFSMQLLLGYIGCICFVTLSPIVIYQVIGGLRMPPIVICTLVAVGFFDNVLFDYLWLRAVLLTSATVAAVGLGLTIPMAILVDKFEESQPVSLCGIIGAFTVLIGFIIVNLGNEDLRSDIEHISKNELVHCNDPFNKGVGYTASDTCSQQLSSEKDTTVASSQTSVERTKRKLPFDLRVEDGVST